MQCLGLRSGRWCAVTSAVVISMMVSILWPSANGNPTNNLVASNGTRTSWWTRGSSGQWQPRHLWDSLRRLPLKVRITTKIKDLPRNKPLPHPDTLLESQMKPVPEAGDQTGSLPCTSCGMSIISSHRGHNQVGPFPLKRRPWHQLDIWPWSVSNGRMDISTVEMGIPNSNSFLMYFKKDGVFVSPFHDIPLFANEGNKIFNMVVEVPRWTNAKMEIATKDGLNPIKQDVKKGKLRYVANVFPHHGYIWNYGALPQTWEDPNHVDAETGCKGDNDPIDVCEIGYRVAKRGDVLQVKVLGTIALIDEGETDWKLIAIDVNDPLAPQLSDISDVEKHMPGFLKATVEWFKIYKIPDGKPENQFAFNGEAKDRAFAHKVIMDVHESWQKLVEGSSDAGGLNTSCVTAPNAVNKLTTSEAEEVVANSPEPGPGLPTDPKVDLWHYVSLK